MTSPIAPDGSPDRPFARVAARVVLVDESDRTFLFRGCDPAAPDVRFWFTVGGGLDEGETPAEAALRELREETGLVVGAGDLIGPIWHQTTLIPFNGLWYCQDQDFFVVRVSSWRVDTDGFDDEERQTIDGCHWWSLPELLATEEPYYPRELPHLLGGILAS